MSDAASRSHDRNAVLDEDVVARYERVAGVERMCGQQAIEWVTAIA